MTSPTPSQTPEPAQECVSNATESVLGEVTCHCGTRFIPKRRHQIHCSSLCRYRFCMGKKEQKKLQEERAMIICEGMAEINRKLDARGMDRFHCNCDACHPEGDVREKLA